jgi:hypothetical protein
METPKEKAKELIDIYKKKVSMTIKDYSLVCKVLDIDMAKQCALIAVDEILKELESFYPKYESWDLKSKLSYWINVKQEIRSYENES